MGKLKSLKAKWIVLEGDEHLINLASFKEIKKGDFSFLEQTHMQESGDEVFAHYIEAIEVKNGREEKSMLATYMANEVESWNEDFQSIQDTLNT